MKVIDYEAEYDNRSRVPEHPQIVEAWARDAAAFRRTAEMEADIAYGPSARHRLDMFFPSPDHRPERLVMFIHGGYWRFFDKSYFSHLARGCLAAGLTVAMPSYSLLPAVRINDVIEDMRLACRFLAHRHGPPITVSGHSAGGHLAAAVLATGWGADGPRINAAQLISGLFDLLPLLETPHNAELRFGPAEARAASPLFWTPPVGKTAHLWVGSQQSSEFKRQSERLALTWGDAGVDTRCDEVPDANHFTAAAPLTDPHSDLTRDLVTLARSGYALHPARSDRACSRRPHLITSRSTGAHASKRLRRHA